jgi:CxxC motif-containing protein
LSIDHHDKEIEISGNLCNKGIECANLVMKNKGILTTLVRVKGSKLKVVSVKSTKPIDKNLWIECSKALSRLYIGAPTRIGDIVCKNILNTGVDIICTKNVERDNE